MSVEDSDGSNPNRIKPVSVIFAHDRDLGGKPSRNVVEGYVDNTPSHPLVAIKFPNASALPGDLFGLISSIRNEFASREVVRRFDETYMDPDSVDLSVHTNAGTEHVPFTEWNNLIEGIARKRGIDPELVENQVLTGVLVKTAFMEAGFQLHQPRELIIAFTTPVEGQVIKRIIRVATNGEINEESSDEFTRKLVSAAPKLQKKLDEDGY